MRIQFINDAAAFALGELTFGSSRQAHKTLFTVIGTGCGSAFGVDGFLAAKGTLGVPPHGYFYSAPFMDSCVDDYISRRGLKKLTKDLLGTPLDGRALAARVPQVIHRLLHAFCNSVCCFAMRYPHR